MHHFELDAMERKAEIQKGRILAKAIIRRGNGRHEAIVVFAGSMPNDFFFTYRIRSPRSPRKTWKNTGALIRYGALDFEKRVAQYAIGATIISIKIKQARKLRQLLEKPDLDFYGQRQEPQAWQVQKINAKMKTKFRGGLPVFHGAVR